MDLWQALVMNVHIPHDDVYYSLNDRRVKEEINYETIEIVNRNISTGETEEKDIISLTSFNAYCIPN